MDSTIRPLGLYVTMLALLFGGFLHVGAQEPVAELDHPTRVDLLAQTLNLVADSLDPADPFVEGDPVPIENFVVDITRFVDHQSNLATNHGVSGKALIDDTTLVASISRAIAGTVAPRWETGDWHELVECRDLIHCRMDRAIAIITPSTISQISRNTVKVTLLSVQMSPAEWSLETIEHEVEFRRTSSGDWFVDRYLAEPVG